MTPQFPQQAQQVENRWLSPMLPSVLAAMSLIATVDPTSLAAAAECQVTEDDGTIPGMTTWKGTTLSIPPLTITVERDIYGELVPSAVPEPSLHMRNSRIDWNSMENHGIATIDVCLGQDIRKSALFNQAMITSIGTTQTKAHKKAMKVFALPYKGNRHILMIRTSPPDIGISVRNTPRTMIGPVQENQKSMLPDPRNVSQAVPRRPSTLESPSLFGGQPFVALNPLQSGLQLPSNESLRMSLTTAQTLHGGNCASGCP